MKLHWFAEVTYPNLPADFREQAPSAWVTPPAHLLDPARAGAMYNMFFDLMEHVDRAGFDGIAVNEHHQPAGAMTPSPNLLAATLARTTKQAAILVIGDSLALYNPPTRVAEEMAYLDCVSGGRLIAGFVYGSAMDSVYSYGVPPVELRPRFAEARELILRAWQADEPFAFNGKYNKLRYVNVWPRPIQKPLPPIWVPGSASVETWDLVSEHDYCYGHLSFSGLHSAKPLVDEYWDYVDARGGNMNPHRMAFVQLVCVSETDAQAEKDYEEAVRYFYRFTNYTSRGFINAPGYRSPRSLTWELERQRSNPLRDKAYRGELSFREYADNRFIVAGSPATVRQQLRELAEQLRVGQLIATLHMGNLHPEIGHKNIDLFATEVMPYLRDLWADEPDYWTPQGRREAAARAARPAAGAAAGD